MDKLVTDIVDEVVNSAEVSISGGSDTEASRPEKSKTGDEKGHVRTASTKKPATFKSVSVNKTFLAAKAATSNAPAKVGDKSASLSASTAAQTPTTSSTLRPRLVAKSGSGLRDNSKTSLAVNGRTAPDASAVWNKNRREHPPSTTVHPSATCANLSNVAVPPPEPKNLTDEDLSKLGIHLATRFQPDETKGQTAWADEEEEEDWAPETIAWADGTKTTIAHADEAAAATHEPPLPVQPAPIAQPASAQEVKPVEKPHSPAPPPMGSPAIKPGVLGSGKGLILKGAPEKPTLVAKPPAPPTPVKSPWAPLPPIDRASPVVTEVQSNQPQRVLPPTNQGHGPQGATPPPAKEIAADDFSRSPWRDGPGHNRELFNSQSGRYEPVTDRRGLAKTDAHSRQPAVLQRPNISEGPAEPSSAFQTSHTSGNYGRRRGSSNVSGGSGGFLQRVGKPHDHVLPPPEVLGVRRGSLTAGSVVSEGTRNFSPSGQEGGPRQQAVSPWQHRASPAITHATPHVPAGSDMNMAPATIPEQVPMGPTQDDIEYQKQLMKERREMAMKRRLEEEAKEEAARKERLRKKLEALGPAPERKSAKKESPSESPATPAEVPAQPQSPQEGKDAKPADIPAAPAKPEVERKSEKLPNGVQPQKQIQTHPQSSSEKIAAPENKQSHPPLWQERGPSRQERVPAQTDRFWNSTGNQPPVSARNVWASPNDNRSLGNGTFNLVADARLAQQAEMQGPVSVPGPIGPPKASGPINKAELPSSSSARQAPIGPPQSSSRYTAPAQRGPPLPDAREAREAKRSAWASAVVGNDAVLFSQRRQQAARDQQELKARGQTLADVQGNIDDNWKAVKLDDRGQRTGGEVSKVTRAPVIAPSGPTWGARPEDMPKQEPTQRPAATTNAVGHNGVAAMASQTGRSRFFPPTQDVRQEERPQARRSYSPSPPPPDMEGHPAFDGDATCPQVLLPPVPNIKFPKAPANASSKAPTTSVSYAPPRSGTAWVTPASSKDPGATHAHPSRPAASAQSMPPTSSRGTSSRPPSQPRDSGDWQARIDNLLGGHKPSPPKPVAVDSSSRNALAIPMQPVPATVSLPGSSVPSAATDDGSFATNRVMDEDCFEVQEMGSLPPVHIPSDTPQNAWLPAAPPPRLDRKLIVASTSAEAAAFDQDHEGANKLFHIKVPHQDKAKTVGVNSYQRTSSNPARRGRGGGGSRYNSSSRGGSGNKARGPRPVHT